MEDEGTEYEGGIFLKENPSLTPPLRTCYGVDLLKSDGSVPPRVIPSIQKGFEDS